MEAIVSTHRPYQCKLCGKRLHSMSALQQHTRIHRFSCPYQCSLCSRSYRLLNQLKDHQEMHGEKPFICSWCDKSFVEQYQLGHHLFREHRVIANGLESQFSNLVNRNHARRGESEGESNNNNKTILEVSTGTDISLSPPLTGKDEEPATKPDVKCGVNIEAKIELDVGNTSHPNSIEEAADCIISMTDEINGVFAGEGVGVDEPSNMMTSEEDVVTIPGLKPIATDSQVPEGTFPNTFQDAKNVDFLPTPESGELDLGTPSDKQIRFLQDNMMLNEDSLTDGSLSDNTRYMLRGDPSLHRCQSGDDLFMFGSLMFAEEKDTDSKSGERPKLAEVGLSGSAWSSSNLSSLVLPNTPHKLSVDPGASSVNVSPAMSPFTASIGQGDSDSEESVGCLLLKDETSESKPEACIEDVLVNGLDKESSVSPGHIDSSAKLPLQPDSITFKKSPEASIYDNFENMEEKQSGKKSKQQCPKKNSESSKRRNVRSFSERAENKKRPLRRTKSASSNKKRLSSLHLDDDDWTPSDGTDADDVPSARLKVKEDRNRSKAAKDKETEAEGGLEYNLRPKRRKTFQSLFHDGCECCINSDGPVQKSVNVQHYIENVTKVEKLRRQVTQLIGTVFPDLKFPPRFKDHGLAVEYLINEVIDAASEKQRIRPNLVPFGPVGGEVRVVLCKYPQGCLRHTRRKISRLLSTLLPDVNSEELESAGATVDDLLTQVIDTNSKVAVESSSSL